MGAKAEDIQGTEKADCALERDSLSFCSILCMILDPQPNKETTYNRTKYEFLLPILPKRHVKPVLCVRLLAGQLIN